MPWPLSSSSISRYVLNHEDSNYFQPSKMKEFVVDFEGRRCSEMQCAKQAIPGFSL